LAAEEGQAQIKLPIAAFFQGDNLAELVIDPTDDDLSQQSAMEANLNQGQVLIAKSRFVFCLTAKM
jgi:hypothetical protein